MTKEQLKTIIEGAVKTNGIQLISGESLQETLKTIVDNTPDQDQITAAYLGVASPSSTPPSTDSWWYDVTEPGTYTNFIKADTNPIILTSTDFEDSGTFYDVKIVVSENVAQVVTRERLVPETDIISTEVIGQSETAYSLDPSSAYFYVKDEPIGFSGPLKTVRFADNTIATNVTLDFIICNKVGSDMVIASKHSYDVMAGADSADLSGSGVSVTEDQRIAFRSYVTGAEHLFRIEVQASAPYYAFSLGEAIVGAENDTPMPSQYAVDYSVEVEVTTPLPEKIAEIENQIAAINPSPFAGKEMYDYGDSRTWYNGHAYESVHSETPNIAKGYQYYVGQKLGTVNVNKGISGATLPQIRTSLVSQDFSTIPYVTITGGVNDWAVGTAIGTIQPEGGTFNTATSYGAVQSMIEHILGQNPEARIFLMTPIRGRIDALGEFPEIYADMFKAIGKLYGIPVCDWYNGLSFNTLTYNEYYKDIGALSDRKIHIGDSGYKRKGDYFVQFLLNNI